MAGHAPGEPEFNERTRKRGRVGTRLNADSVGYCSGKKRGQSPFESAKEVMQDRSQGRGKGTLLDHGCSSTVLRSS